MVSRRLIPDFSLSRLAAVLALLALTFHGLTPLTHQLARQVQAANGIEQVVLCSALGLRVMALKDGAPVDTDPSKSETIAKTCPVCFVANLQPAILPTMTLLAAPLVAITVLFGAAPQSTAAQAASYSPPARAPPLPQS